MRLVGLVVVVALSYQGDGPDQSASDHHAETCRPLPPNDPDKETTEGEGDEEGGTKDVASTYGSRSSHYEKTAADMTVPTIPQAGVTMATIATAKALDES